MPTWSFWNNSRFDWARFIDTSFAALNQQQVPNLVVDIRANEGGDGAIGDRLLAHLISQPVRYSRQQNVSADERVPYVLARYLATWDFGFFDRTGDVEKITEGTAIGKCRVKSKTTTPDASVIPELLVAPSFAAAAAGRDLTMEAVMAATKAAATP